MKTIIVLFTLLVALSGLAFAAPAPRPQWIYPSYAYTPISYYTSSYYTSPYYTIGYGYSSPYVYI